jgi:serine/threonine protein kinase
VFVCSECGTGLESGGFCPSDGTKLAARGDDILLGQTVGTYRVACLLGVGGMGRVYKGVHPTIGSRVAIKVLSRECTDNPELVERFFAEARAVNLIRHESIVNVIDLSSLPDGRPYIVMEYLDGAPLSDVITNSPNLPLGALARVLGEVLDALSAAHAKAIVHRDLKPDNIFVSPQGRAKVLDFGIAKLMPELSGRSAPTRTGSLLGTPHYMAPEQALAQPIDLRTDIYACGVILFEGATGTKPFRASSLFDLLRKHIDEPPPPPRSLRPDMPTAYEEVILRSLAKKPDDRFQSASALANALAAAAQPLPPEAWQHIGGATRATPQMGPPSVRTPAPAPGPQMQHAATPVPTPGQQPYVQPHQPHQPSTVSSGQVQPHQPYAPTRAKSRTGLWIGVGLVAIAATVGIVLAATSGGGDGDGEGDRIAATSSDDEAKDDEAATETDEDGDGEGGDDDDDQDKDIDEETDEDVEAAAPDMDMKTALEQIEKLDQMTEEAAATLEEELAKLEESGIKIGGGSMSSPGTSKPADFDPAKFDVSKYSSTALETVRAEWDDAVLVRIDANGVRPDGMADLTLSDTFSVIYRFVSKSRKARPKDLPKGVPYEPECMYYVWVDKNGIRPYPLPGFPCDDAEIAMPKCTLEQVWKQAAKRGAPTDNSVAEISYRAWQGKVSWYFTVGDSYSGRVADTCK